MTTDRPKDDKTDLIQQHPSKEGRAIGKAIQERLGRLGEVLADSSPYGTLYAIGADKPGDKRTRWMVVLATNDVADHLEEWAAAEALQRAEASHAPGCKAKTETVIIRSKP